MRWARDFRLIPLVLLATVSLFALKVSGLIFDGGYTLGERLRDRNQPDKLTVTNSDSVPAVTPIVVANSQPATRQSWAQEMFNYGGDASRDITGSVDSKPAAPPPSAANKAANPPKSADGVVVNTDAAKLAPAGERAILESLSDRRTEIDARAKEMDMRESLLKAAEKRVEARIAELKALENKVNDTIDARDKAEAERFKNIVSMYENMKPKDAARIFDKLDMRVLIDVATQINPRKMSEIMAQMTADAAQQLTVELAARAAAKDKKQTKDSLPKIDGRPSGT
ncbi:MAG: flagellar protein FlbB [Pseudolabrys sp.]|nr:flagellar protein FlbB [Pseudolabrys sp.]MBV9261348.1 flagellar protein FlbB [Pseudolabrys sp.]